MPGVRPCLTTLPVFTVTPLSFVTLPSLQSASLSPLFDPLNVLPLSLGTRQCPLRPGSTVLRGPAAGGNWLSYVTKPPSQPAPAVIGYMNGAPPSSWISIVVMNGEGDDVAARDSQARGYGGANCVARGDRTDAERGVFRSRVVDSRVLIVDRYEFLFFTKIHFPGIVLCV